MAQFYEKRGRQLDDEVISTFAERAVWNQHGENKQIIDEICKRWKELMKEEYAKQQPLSQSRKEMSKRGVSFAEQLSVLRYDADMDSIGEPMEVMQSQAPVRFERQGKRYREADAKCPLSSSTLMRCTHSDGENIEGMRSVVNTIHSASHSDATNTDANVERDEMFDVTTTAVSTTMPIDANAVGIEAPLDETDGGDEYVLPEDDQEPDCWLIGVMHKLVRRKRIDRTVQFDIKMSGCVLATPGATMPFADGRLETQPF